MIAAGERLLGRGDAPAPATAAAVESPVAVSTPVTVQTPVTVEAPPSPAPAGPVMVCTQSDPVMTLVVVALLLVVICLLLRYGVPRAAPLAAAA